MPKFSRRSFITAAGAAAAAPAFSNSRALDARPNIVFILADDLGFADLGCYGRSDIATPNIDSLARRGMLFDYAYAASSVCSPSRLALLTGRYPGRERAGDEEVLATHGEIGITQPSFVTALRLAGYQTSLVGKWHLGDRPEFSPLRHGYERFFGFTAGALDYFTHTNPRGEAELFEDDRIVERNGYLTNLFGQRATAEVRRMGRLPRPFLLSLHFNAPHWPWEGAKDEKLAQSRPRTLEAMRDYDGGTMATYRSMIETMDRNIGSVLGALRKSGHERNTLVAFTSDNGGERYSDTWPLSGRKGELLEGGIRVPQLVQWPRVIRPSSRVDQMAITMDWAATALDLAGASMGGVAMLDGVSLRPTFAGAPPTERTLFWRHKAHAQRAVRRGSLKYLSIEGRDYLFDVATDSLERANLKGKYPDDYAMLKNAWTNWNSGLVPYPPDSDSEDYHGVLPDRY